MRSISILIVLALFSTGAKKEASATVPAPSEAPQFATFSGTVLETMDASGYTYMRLETASGEMWAAVNKTKVVKGDKVTVANAMPMDGFQSKTLNRTFDKIVFGVLAVPGGAAPATKEQMAAQHGQASGGPEEMPDVKVPKAEGANAKTVAELWALRASLNGKDVAVKAKVVKATAGVMGKNWLHMRDGSGSKATKDNDLTVTTDANAKVGDVVTVSGTVSVDKDFGAGYAYPVIIENAKLK